MNVPDASDGAHVDAGTDSTCTAAACDGGVALPDAGGDEPPSGPETDDAGVTSPRGMAAWVYTQQEHHVAAVLAHQSAVGAGGLRFRYLFPYAGSLSIAGPGEGEQELWYDPSATEYYGRALPGVLHMPNIDSGDGNALGTLDAEVQERLAEELAAAVLSDPWAAGAQVDVEPFRDEHLPFYRRLRTLLNEGGKTLAVFTGRTAGDIYGSADIVVLSGYDLGLEPLSREAYAAALTTMTATAADSARAAGSSLLLGIPASASWEEYESGSGTCEGSTGVTQQEWVASALDAACPAFTRESMLGLALWQLADGPLELGFEPGCERHPDGITPDVWTLLAELRPDACGD